MCIVTEVAPPTPSHTPRHEKHEALTRSSHLVECFPAVQHFYRFAVGVLYSKDTIIDCRDGRTFLPRAKTAQYSYSRYRNSGNLKPSRPGTRTHATSTRWVSNDVEPMISLGLRVSLSHRSHSVSLSRNPGGSELIGYQCGLLALHL
jgi:hypothetical protein